MSNPGSISTDAPDPSRPAAFPSENDPVSLPNEVRAIKNAPLSSAHQYARLRSPDRQITASQRRIDGLLVFFFEPCDQFGGRQDFADAAYALAAAPDFLPGFRFGALARCVGAEAHFRRVELRKVVGIHPGRDDRRLQIIAVHAGEQV